MCTYRIHMIQCWLEELEDVHNHIKRQMSMRRFLQPGLHPVVVANTSVLAVRRHSDYGVIFNPMADLRIVAHVKIMKQQQVWILQNWLPKYL